MSVPARAVRSRRWLVALIGLSLVGTAGWRVTHSRIFALRSLRVSGNVHLSSTEVASIGGLDDRTNVLWLSSGALVRRLELDPWIRDVRISRTLPSAISIAIVERTPVAVIAGSRQLVSSDGVLLGHADLTGRLPVIQVELSGRTASGRIRSDLPALRIAGSLTGGLAREVARIGFDRSGRLALTLRDGTKVLWGDAEDGTSKAAALLALVRWIDRRGIRPACIDVSVPAAPALLLSGGGGVISGA